MGKAIITTILEKLKITNPSRDEKGRYILMQNDDKEVCAVPVESLLARVNKRIDGIVYPDGFTKVSSISIVDNEITIPAGDFEWKIDLNPYKNVLFEQVIPETSDPAFNRIDSLAATSEGTIVYYQGQEVDETEIALPPIVPAGQLHLTDIYVLGSAVAEPTTPPITEIFTKEEKDKLAILDPTADIDKPVSTAQAAADAATLTAANDYTDDGLALKLNTADYNDRYKGKYTSLGALETAHPTANAGDYAQVDAGSGSDVVNYNWDSEEGWVTGSSSGSGATNTDALPEGSTNLYFTTARVLATVLTGVSFLTGGAIVSTDSVLVAFGKLQKQISDLLTAVAGKQDTLVSGTNIKTINGSSILGSGNITVGGSETTTSIGALIGSAGDATPNDSDYVATAVTGGGILKKITWTNVKAFLKTYFDGLYAPKTISTVETGTSFTLDNTYHGKIVILTASCTVTLPNGLMSGFEVTIATLAGVTLTLSTGGSVVLKNNAGTTMAEKLSCTFKGMATANNYLTAGGL